MRHIYNEEKELEAKRGGINDVDNLKAMAKAQVFAPKV
jgi:hypothetical protein